MKRLSDESLQKLKTIPSKDNESSHGLCSYDTLVNIKYCDAYMYLPGASSDKSHQKLIVSRYTEMKMKKYSMCVVRCVTDLAYMPRERARDLKFDPVYLYKNH